MTTAYRIHQRTGITPLVFEAADRIGGRTRTTRSLRGDQWCEAGGTFVSSGDRAIRGLMKELGTGLIDLNVHYPSGRRVLFLKNKERTPTEVFKDRPKTARHARRQFDRIPWPVTHRESNAAAEHWDAVSVAEWIEEFTPRGLDSLYGRYLKTYFETDYAGAIDDASSLHLIADFAAPGRNYDERFQIRGGSDRIVRALRRRLPDASVSTATPLTKIGRHDGGGCTCTFSGPAGPLEVDADHVVLALPFSALRDVDYAEAGFSDIKDAAIKELRMGVNTKVNLQFEREPWGRNRSGEAITDLVTGWSWPGSSGQKGPEAILVLFNGAEFTDTYTGSPAHGRASDELTALHLAAVDRIFPGASDSFIPGEAYLDHWPADVFTKGSYSYYGTGGFTSFAGIEGRRQGSVHFAGEHTARYGNRGTMNGAVRSGELAAREVIASL